MSFHVNVERNKKESFGRVLRRFHRRVRASGKILEVRKHKFFMKDPNRNAQKRSALRRIRQSKKREYLLKTGQITDNRRRRR